MSCFKRSTVTACLRIYHVAKHDVQYLYPPLTRQSGLDPKTLSRRQVKLFLSSKSLEILPHPHRDACQKFNLHTLSSRLIVAVTFRPLSHIHIHILYCLAVRALLCM